jgi:hypothetical protein
VTETASRPAIAPGTLMRKIVPPRLVGPYLTGQRDVLAGFVYRDDDLAVEEPADVYQALGLGFAGSEFVPEMSEYYAICWPARPFDGYQYRGDTADIAEFFIEPIPIPVGAEMRRVRAGEPVPEFVAQYDGLAWQQVDEEG